MLKRMLFLLLLFPMICFAESFVAGKDYEVIQGVSGKSKSNKVRVVEFFSYGCPWCYRVDPALTQWANTNADAVKFSQVPVVFHKEWIFFAKAFYVADLLGIRAKISPELFKAIQTDKKTLSSNQEMIDFFIAHGVDKETAESAFNHSTTVDLKIQQSSALMGKLHVTAVPAIVVNGKYKTDLQMAKGEKRLLQVLDFLVEKSR